MDKFFKGGKRGNLFLLNIKGINLNIVFDYILFGYMYLLIKLNFYIKY